MTADPVTAEAVESPRPVALTDRELQVLFLASFGRKNGEIGRELFVSEDTVKTHFRHLMKKLQARDRAHAVRVALELGVLKLRDLSVVAATMPPPTVALDWQVLERDRLARDQLAQVRPLSDLHIGACYAAQACPCREGATWRWPTEQPGDPAAVKP